ncbi:response regulator transcription factor [Dehalococcoides mccartyi]|uniref:response regulator transcription factor n=1 Tax=Dehalococcoides mccartyi TaxID=61435 RepID=UPI0006BE0F0C|nr:response regulator transcription factor [Dehalococcoides mccartyi]BAS32401.1 signal transduction response regulator,OmpR family [Dehalococcoides mccartyi IBARAKI]
MNIILIEDQEDVVEYMSIALRMCWPDIEIQSTASGQEGIELAAKGTADLITLDLGLSDVSGFEVLKAIRLFSQVPIIIITVRSDEIDIVKGLDLGAQEYIVKPFGQMEFLARIRSLLRWKTVNRESFVFTCGGLYLNTRDLVLQYLGHTIKLTRTEAVILRELIKAEGKTLPYKLLCEQVWGDNCPYGSDNIKVHIRNLRVRIESDPNIPQFIFNKFGIGYYISTCK